VRESCCSCTGDDADDGLVRTGSETALTVAIYSVSRIEDNYKSRHQIGTDRTQHCIQRRCVGLQAMTSSIDERYYAWMMENRNVLSDIVVLQDMLATL
jgi:DNA repair ATPase RecN